MEQYIKKSTLVSEIENLLKPIKQRLERDKNNPWDSDIAVYKFGIQLIKNLDTIEVKEVSLEDYNKVKGTLSLSFMQFLDSHRQEGKMCLSNGECFDIDKAFDEMDFAKLFRYMEKYLKAQKGE